MPQIRNIFIFIPLHTTGDGALVTRRGAGSGGRGRAQDVREAAEVQAVRSRCARQAHLGGGKQLRPPGVVQSKPLTPRAERRASGLSVVTTLMHQTHPRA
jgi:hypothetical protein